MEAGQLVPDALVLDMLFDRVQGADCNEGYILDGFPRTAVQAEALEASLEQMPGSQALSVIQFVVPDEVLVSRISGRLVCGACGAVYHRTAKPPLVEGQCNACEGTVVQRKDDSAEVVLERLQVYRKQTAPLVDYYEERGVLSRIDADGSMDDVFDQLLPLVEGKD